jgi:hypothetical protein
MTSCVKKIKRINPFVTLWRQDKIPYGTYYAFENLKYIFPAAEITINRSSPGDYVQFGTFRIQADSASRIKKKGYIIISPRVIPDQREINAMMNFVGSGNQVFISSFHFGDSLLSALKIKVGYNINQGNSEDSLKLSIYHPVTYDSTQFGYPGFTLESHVDSLDSQYTSILGRDGRGRPDFVKFGYKGGGALFLHFAPLAFSNFFLLHGNNKAYYDQALSYMSPNLEEVKWDDYFRNAGGSRFSAFQFILSSRSLRWAFWLVLLLFAIIYLIESKRRQRLIPKMGPKRNSSLDFVKTIGRLYYQQKDHPNLAAKMITHFLDHVRTRYNLPTSLLNDEFVERLSYKSGYDRQSVKEIVTEIRMFQDGLLPGDADMLEFNKKLEAFYKQV